MNNYVYGVEAAADMDIMQLNKYTLIESIVLCEDERAISLMAAIAKEGILRGAKRRDRTKKEREAWALILGLESWKMAAK